MKIRYIKLTNYIGIYNGLGLKEIYINFENCKNKIVLIRGNNGSGKSELFKSMNMFPDSNNRLIPQVPAKKEISYIDGDIIYNIKIIHDIKKNGKRDTTKAYIKKITSLGIDELNPNGNISSYKDIISSEFSLDPNFISLSELSSNDRGLADKIPSERKKFVNSIINTLQVYNNIYKTLSKRSSIFKSFLNNIISKIDEIGNEDNLKLTLKSLENRLNKLMNEKDNTIEKIASLKSKVQLLDPDKSIQKTYDIIYNDIKCINDDYANIINKLKINIKKLKLPLNIELDEINDKYKNILQIIKSLEISIKVNESKIQSLLIDKEKEANQIQEKQTKINSIKSNININELKKSISDTKENINNYKQIINKIGIKEYISKNEFVLGLNTLKEIKEIINIFKSNMDYNIIEKSISYYKNNLYPDIDIINNDIENIKDNLSCLKTEYQKYIMLQKISSKLLLRPSKCKINNCQFIKDAIDAEKEKPDINLKRIEKEILNNKTLLENKKKICVEYNKIIECINYLKSMIRNLNKYSSILNKLPINNILNNDNLLLDNILNGYDFNEIDELYKYIEYSNIMELYRSEIDKYNVLNNDYILYKEKNKKLNEIINDINKLNKSLNHIVSHINKFNIELNDDKNKLSKLKNNILDYDILINLYNKKNLLQNKKNEILSRFNCIKSNIINIKECLNFINKENINLNNINKQINPLIQERDNIKHNLKLLIQYNEELNQYNLKYEKIETIKKYSSPNKGIQTLFMSLYMNKTISMTNELLSLLFNGKYILGEFQINESEFKIPCIGNNIQNDDISSMSTAQVCMISMILSFVILKQSSTRYNILKLDEIDGALDTFNRIKFLNVLYELIDILNVEQCIMISHNTEMDTSNCDIIQLKINNEDRVKSGNIIYEY